MVRVGGMGVAVGLGRVGTGVAEGGMGVALAVGLAVGVAVASGDAVLVTSNTGNDVGDGAPGSPTTSRAVAVCTGSPPYAASVHEPSAAACGTIVTNLKWPSRSTVTVPRLIGTPVVDSAGLSSNAML